MEWARNDPNAIQDQHEAYGSPADTMKPSRKEHWTENDDANLFSKSARSPWRPGRRLHRTSSVQTRRVFFFLKFTHYLDVPIPSSNHLPESVHHTNSIFRRALTVFLSNCRVNIWIWFAIWRFIRRGICISKLGFCNQQWLNHGCNARYVWGRTCRTLPIKNKEL